MKAFIIILLCSVIPASAQIVSPSGAMEGFGGSDTRYVNILGDTMTGPLTLSGSSLTVTGASQFASKVGIGISVPVFDLDIRGRMGLNATGDAVSTSMLQISTTVASRQGIVLLDRTSLTANAGLPLAWYGTNAAAGLVEQGKIGAYWENATSTSAYFSVQLRDDNVASSEKLRINGSDGSASFLGNITATTGTITGNAFSVGTSTFVVTAGNVGIGTTTPVAQLHIKASANQDYALKISSSTGESSFGVHPDGHLSIYGSTTSLATCANAAMTSNSRDTAGSVTFSGANSSCGISFGSQYDATPVCVMTGVVATATEGAIISQISASSMTFVPNTGAWDAGDKVNYICVGIH